MNRTALSLALIAFLSTGTMAADKIVGRLITSTEDGVTSSDINFVYASCEEECHVATLSCENAAIGVVMADVDAAIAGKAITQENKQIVLKAGSASFDYSIYKMEFMEMTGSWWLTGLEQGSDPGAIADAIGKAETVELQAGKMKVSLPVDAVVKDWAKACR